MTNILNINNSSPSDRASSASFYNTFSFISIVYLNG